MAWIGQNIIQYNIFPIHFQVCYGQKSRPSKVLALRHITPEHRCFCDMHHYTLDTDECIDDMTLAPTLCLQSLSVFEDFAHVCDSHFSAPQNLLKTSINTHCIDA